MKDRYPAFLVLVREMTKCKTGENMVEKTHCACIFQVFFLAKREGNGQSSRLVHP